MNIGCNIALISTAIICLSANAYAQSHGGVCGKQADCDSANITGCETSSDCLYVTAYKNAAKTIPAPVYCTPCMWQKYECYNAGNRLTVYYTNHVGTCTNYTCINWVDWDGGTGYNVDEKATDTEGCGS